MLRVKCAVMVSGMRIGKPLLITTTAIGLPIGIYEGFHLAGTLGFLMVTLVALFGMGIVWVVRTVRVEKLAEREARARRETG